MMRNLVSVGLGLCAAGCIALTAVPALAIPAEAACGLGAAAGVGGLLLWKSAPKEAAV